MANRIPDAAPEWFKVWASEEKAIRHKTATYWILANFFVVASATYWMGSLSSTKEDLQKEIRILRKELLENDKHLLRWVLASHGDKAIKQAIRDQLTDVESKIQNLDRALTNNLPEIPDLFKAAVGKIEGYEPASGLLKIRTLDNKLVQGKVDPGHVVGDIPITKELIGKDADVIFKGPNVFAVRIYDNLE